jgi:hypothetical protein
MVIPAQAGNHLDEDQIPLDSRLRGNDAIHIGHTIESISTVS